MLDTKHLPPIPAPLNLASLLWDLFSVRCLQGVFISSCLARASDAAATAKAAATATAAAAGATLAAAASRAAAARVAAVAAAAAAVLALVWRAAIAYATGPHEHRSLCKLLERTPVLSKIYDSGAAAGSQIRSLALTAASLLTLRPNGFVWRLWKARKTPDCMYLILRASSAFEYIDPVGTKRAEDALNRYDQHVPIKLDVEKIRELKEKMWNNHLKEMCLSGATEVSAGDTVLLSDAAASAAAPSLHEGMSTRLAAMEASLASQAKLIEELIAMVKAGRTANDAIPGSQEVRQSLETNAAILAGSGSNGGA